MNRFITTVALAVVTLPALSAPTVQTLTGVVKGGTADSCLNVGAGKDEKCYSFGSRSSIAMHHGGQRGLRMPGNFDLQRGGAVGA